MEEAMSHTGIRQFYLSLQWLYYFFPLTPAWAEIALFPLIHPSTECWRLICGCMLWTI